MTNITVSADSSPSGWRHTINTATLLRPTHVVEFDVSGNGWGCVGLHHNNTHYLVGLNTSGNPTVQYWNGSAYTAVAGRTETYSGNMHIKCMFTEVQYGSTDDVWVNVAMWINGFHVINYAVRTGALISEDCNFGLAVAHNTSKTFSNVTIPQMTEMAEAVTLDVNENAAGGLNRAIEGRYLKYFIRFDGRLKAYRPAASPIAYVFTENDYGPEMRIRYQRYVVKTHVRMVGAYESAEYTDRTLVNQYGYAFKEFNNPYLMSRADCLLEAINTIRRLREQSVSANPSGSAFHFIEIEDRILMQGNVYQVSGFSLNYRAGVAMQRFTLRGDFYDG